MKFETVLIHFLSDVLVCCHPKILLPWQRDVTTSPLYTLVCLPEIAEGFLMCILQGKHKSKFGIGNSTL